MTAKSEHRMNQTARRARAFLPAPPVFKLAVRFALVVAALLVLSLLIWQGITASGAPNPESRRPGSLSGILDVAVLVFREGLECVLVLSAITAGMAKSGESYQRPVSVGVGIGFLATLLTWFVASASGWKRAWFVLRKPRCHVRNTSARLTCFAEWVSCCHLNNAREPFGNP
jgi:hypothetical protein